ncbi:MAG: hypothetical protein GY703_23240 [Gammaproteobacteria bacterium]|nr:hypothetical protein [Gammaproteobacteria bacterium]
MQQRTVVDAGDCSSDVSIQIDPIDGIRSYGFEESLSFGLFPQDVSAGGRWDQKQRSIKWGLFNDDRPREVPYKITGRVGTYHVEGVGSYNGLNEVTSGDRWVSITSCSAPQETVVTPTLSSSSEGEVPLWVTIESATIGAVIRYTTDGSAPDKQSPVYTLPLQVEGSLVLRAKAFKTGMVPSEVVTASYLPPEPPGITYDGILLDDRSCSVGVEISVIPGATANVHALEESLPLGLHPSEIVGGGIWNHQSRTIRWGPFSDAESRSVGYVHDFWNQTFDSHTGCPDPIRHRR